MLSNPDGLVVTMPWQSRALFDSGDSITKPACHWRPGQGSLNGLIAVIAQAGGRLEDVIAHAQSHEAQTHRRWVDIIVDPGPGSPTQHWMFRMVR